MTTKEKTETGRRGAILSAAKKLFYTYGFSSTSMDAVAREAGVSKGLIYHYFQDKEHLLLAFDEEMEAYLDALLKMESPLSALRQFGVDFLVNDPEKYAAAPPVQILLTTFADHTIDVSRYEKQNPILKDFGREYLGMLFRLGIGSGIFRPGSPEQYGDIYWSFLMGKLLPVKKGNESADPEEYVEEILSIFERR